MKNLNFCGQNFLLHPSGMLIWPSQNIAMIADLHLEKGSHFAMNGQLLPPHDSLYSLQLLLDTLSASGATHVILLGDSFHDAAGFERMGTASLTLFQQLCTDYQVTWILGNHDGSFIPAGTKGVIDLVLHGISLRHEADNKAFFKPGQGEISGHFHPKARLKRRGQRVSRACFLEDGRRMILPAFGAYTGGLDVCDPVYRLLFPTDFTAHLLGKEKIYSIPRRELF